MRQERGAEGEEQRRRAHELRLTKFGDSVENRAQDDAAETDDGDDGGARLDDRLEQRRTNRGQTTAVWTSQQRHEHEHQHDGQILEQKYGEGGATMSTRGFTSVGEHLHGDSRGGERQTQTDDDRRRHRQTTRDRDGGADRRGQHHLRRTETEDVLGHGHQTVVR